MKQLITEGDILNGSVGRRLVLDANTLITPSARDRAARLGIAIVQDGSATGGWHAVAPTAATAAPCPRCGNATCSCPAASTLELAAGGGHAATLGALADGLYLVRVQGGRAVQVLPATGPGVMVRAAGTS